MQVPRTSTSRQRRADADAVCLQLRLPRREFVRLVSERRPVRAGPAVRGRRAADRAACATALQILVRQAAVEGIPVGDLIVRRDVVREKALCVVIKNGDADLLRFLGLRAARLISVGRDEARADELIVRHRYIVTGRNVHAELATDTGIRLPAHKLRRARRGVGARWALVILKAATVEVAVR